MSNAIDYTWERCKKCGQWSLAEIIAENAKRQILRCFHCFKKYRHIFNYGV